TATGNCPISSSDGTNADVEISCTTSGTDDGTTQTQSITCPITSAGTYELLVVPNSIFSCDPADPVNCPDGGITGTVPATLTGDHQPDLPTAKADGGTVWGAGQVAP